MRALGTGMMTKTLSTLAVSSFVLVACAHDNAVDQPATTSATYQSPAVAAAPVSPRAVEEIASARCDREQTCNNIGADKTYATRDVCVGKLRADNQNDLTNASCPNGLSRPGLDKCLADIRGERCDHPLDTLARLNACTRSSICQ
jgi:hypothetical protein